MNQDDLYYNTSQSLIAFLRDFQACELPDSSWFDFDAHAQASELPAGTLIGPAGLGLIYEAQGMASVAFGFGIMVDDDPNLFNLKRVISKLAGRLTPGTVLPIYDTESTERIAWMKIVPPVAVTPVSSAEIRSAQFVTAHALVDPLAV